MVRGIALAVAMVAALGAGAARSQGTPLNKWWCPATRSYYATPEMCPSTGYQRGQAGQSTTTPTTPLRNRGSDPYADSYANEQAAHNDALLDNFLNYVKNLYFAVGCKVARAELVYADLIFPIEDTIIYQVPGMSPRINQMEDKAKRAGLEQATKEGCDYWQQHPEAVYAIRQAINGSTGPTTTCNPTRMPDGSWKCL